MENLEKIHGRIISMTYSLGPKLGDSESLTETEYPEFLIMEDDPKFTPIFDLGLTQRIIDTPSSM